MSTSDETRLELCIRELVDQATKLTEAQVEQLRSLLPATPPADLAEAG